MFDPITLLAGAAVVTGGYGIYSSERAYSDAKSAAGRTPPAPSNYYEYDEFGNVVAAQVWDEKANAYKYMPNPEPVKPKVTDAAIDREARRLQTEDQQRRANENPDGYAMPHSLEMFRDQARKNLESSSEYKEALTKWEEEHADWEKKTGLLRENKEKRDRLRSEMLDNLSQAPADRVAQYEAYGDAYQKAARKAVIPKMEETFEKRGLTGSKAYATGLAEAESEIADQSIFAKEALKSADRNYWLNVLNSLDSGARADTALALQQSQNAANLANIGTAARFGQYSAGVNNALTQAQIGAQRGNNLMDTASGLMFLYGLKKPGVPKTPSASINSGGTSLYRSGTPSDFYKVNPVSVFKS